MDLLLYHPGHPHRRRRRCRGAGGATEIEVSLVGKLIYSELTYSFTFPRP